MIADFKPALEGRAIVNLQMSNTFAAFQDINASIYIVPTAELLTNRGVISQFMNDRVNAMRDYRLAIEMDPKYSLAYFNAGNVYFHTRHFRQVKLQLLFFLTDLLFGGHIAYGNFNSFIETSM